MATRRQIVDNAGIAGEYPRHSTSPEIYSGDFTVAFVGQPNVGKSVIMNLLTGAGAIVSNYSGTTVEITQGHFLYGSRKIRVIDTPGTYSLHSDTEEQKVTQRVLLEGNIDLIVNVTDARNLSRNLYLTLQLMDLNIPIFLVLNQMDMAEESGMQINAKLLSEVLQLPVIPMVASRGEGLDRLTEAIASYSVSYSKELNAKSGTTANHVIRAGINPLVFSDPVEDVIEMLQGHIEELIPEEDGKHRLHPSRALAIHLMEHDSLDEDLFKTYPELAVLVEQLQISAADGNAQCHGCFRGCGFCTARDESHPNLPTCLERTQKAQEIALAVTKRTCRDSVSLRALIERFLDQPSTGIPALGLIAYLSLKLIFVILDFAESFVPWALGPVLDFIESIAGSFPHGSLAKTIISAIPEGILLPFEVVMPTMLSVYFIMAVLEDSGLMPRIAVMMDRAMSFLKLPGQSIIPIVLGFGCRAPGVLATRALPGRSSRLVVSALLAIPIPCAATLGIIAGVGKSFGADLKIVYGSIAIVFVLLARVLAHFLKSNQELILEVPPVQIPSAKRVGAKVWMRFEGFFKEVLPILLITGIGVKILLNTEVLSWLARLDPISVKFFGVTGQSLAAVAVTVVQRYAAPMVLLNLPLGPREATIATSMISLSMPCLPVSFLITREFGWNTLAAIFSISMVISLGSGIVLNLILPAF